jgi:hypothetical protein
MLAYLHFGLQIVGESRRRNLRRGPRGLRMLSANAK